MTPTAPQVRQACALLGWKSGMLANCAKISYTTAMRAKTDDGLAALPFMDVWAIRTALEKAGVQLTSDVEGRSGTELRAMAT